MSPTRDCTLRTIPSVLICVAMLLAPSGVARADPAEAALADLYSAVVVVTGRDNLAERERGVREALPKALVRVSGDSGAADRAAMADVLGTAGAMVTGLDYLDRKAGIQISDEQGTRERSFELTVHFDPARVDATLTGLGMRPWHGPRPEVAVALLIDNGHATWLLTRTSDLGYGQRLVVEDVSRELALPARLPERAGGGDPEADLSAALRTAPLRLEWRMTATPDGYWTAIWQLSGRTGVAQVKADFAFDHVTFDIAIGDALRATARHLAALSGN
jgi:hypothetical protein